MKFCTASFSQTLCLVLCFTASACAKKDKEKKATTTTRPTSTVDSIESGKSSAAAGPIQNASTTVPVALSFQEDRSLLQITKSPNAFKAYDLCDPLNFADINKKHELAMAEFDSLSSGLADAVPGDFLDKLDGAKEVFSAFAMLQKETDNAYNVHSNVLQNYCNKMKADIPANTARETCVPDDTTAIDIAKATMTGLVTAVSAADIAYTAIKDTGHAAAWGFLLIAAGAGTGAPCAAAITAAATAGATARSAITVAKIALKAMDFTIQAIEFAAVTTGCQFKKTRAIHDIAFETFELADNYLDYLSCPFDGKVFIPKQRSPMNPVLRGGCDGIDNDCDSNVLLSVIDPNGNRAIQTIVKRVDECDEDLIPPTITLAKPPPASFYTQAHAEAWFASNTVVSDDCVASADLTKTSLAVTANSITFSVEDKRCGKKSELSGSVNSVQDVIVDGPGSFTNTATFNFLIEACPNSGSGAIGEGCDGIDNDCDSSFVDVNGNEITPIRRVDECDEDLVRPTITLTEDIPDFFSSLEEAQIFFMANTVADDDCVSRNNLQKSILDANVDACGAGSMDIEVCTPCVDQQVVNADVNGVPNRVVDGPGESCALQTFNFQVDGNPPTVTCGFHKPQDIHHVRPQVPPFVDDGSMTAPEPVDGEPLHIDFFNEDKDLVNVEFWYEIQEENAGCPPEEVKVDVTVLSNELEKNGREMVDFFVENNLVETGQQQIASDPVHRLTLLLAPHTCQDGRANDSRKSTCLVERGTNANTQGIAQTKVFTTRFYDIKVRAADPAGNTGETICTVIVVPEDHYDCDNGKCKSSKKANKDRSPRMMQDENSSTEVATDHKTGKGKGSPPLPHTPTDDLVQEYQLSTKRFIIGSQELVWNTGLDTNINIATPGPTMAPTGGKGKGKDNTRRMRAGRDRRPVRGTFPVQVVDMEISASGSVTKTVENDY